MRASARGSACAPTSAACRSSASAAPAASPASPTAARLAAAEPGTRWLFVTVETCSISIRLDSDDPAAIVATALFGDGAAAAVVGGDGDGHRADRRIGRESVARHARHHGLAGRGSGPRGDLRPRDPAVHRGRAGGSGRLRCSTRSGVARGDIDRFCCHPGGAKVIDAIETRARLPPGALDLEREVLRDHGNMSAPTVLFVLDALIARGLPQPLC